MKTWKYLVMALIFATALFVAQPSWADAPSITKNPEYIEVTKTLNNLIKAKNAQTQVENYTPDEIQAKIDELEFQKYTLETGLTWGQCRNETGRTLAVYGPKPHVEDDDYNSSYDTGLYFLADGQTTKNRWDCEGVYLPNDVATNLNANGQEQPYKGGVAVKIPHGTNVVVSTNSDTSAVEFNLPGTKVFKAGEVNWFIPNVSQAVIDTRVPDAPTDRG